VVEVHRLHDDGVIPNGLVPVLSYRSALPADPVQIERRFGEFGWTGSWRNGVFPYHHYHSTTHEVLGVYSGSATIRLGGERGIDVEVHSGDVVVIPAGVAHKRICASADFGVVGAYPDGRHADMNYCRLEEREHALANIRGVPVPKLDPVLGPDGPLVRHWGENPGRVASE